MAILSRFGLSLPEEVVNVVCQGEKEDCGSDERVHASTDDKEKGVD